MVRRADALAAIMNAKKGIVICGMHGKTTTSFDDRARAPRMGGLKPSHYVNICALRLRAPPCNESLPNVSGSLNETAHDDGKQ